MKRTALLAGATGAVGAKLLDLLLGEERYSEVKVVVRRALSLKHPKLRVIEADLAALSQLGAALKADDVFCCLGTTLKKAGSREAFEAVDYGMVLELARAAKAQGAKQFLVVSAAGTSATSPSFYSRVKARMEQDVAALDYESLHVVRPSLLMGDRAESRPGERAAQMLMPLLNPLMLGDLKKYRPVHVADVASALLTLALRDQPGKHIHHLPLE